MRLYTILVGYDFSQTSGHRSLAVSDSVTYGVSGKQYVAVMTGDGLLTQGLVKQVAPEVKTVAGHNAIYVFAPPRK